MSLQKLGRRTRITTFLGLALSVSCADTSSPADLGELADSGARDAADLGAPEDATTAEDASPPDATLVEDAGEAPDAGFPEFELEPLTWAACAGGPEGPSGFECARARVPLDWSATTGRFIELPVARVRSAAGLGPIVRQIWYLTGGPGGSLQEGYLAQQMRELTQGVATEIIAIALRGTAGPDALTCTQAADEVLLRFDDPDAVRSALAPCVAELQAEWGDGLAHFSTTNDARDLIALSKALGRPDATRFLWGTSYGTVRAQRVLGLDPDFADGVILDSALGLDRSYPEFQLDVDGTAAWVFARCAMDPECAARFDGDPWAVALDTMAMIRGGHCPTSLGLGTRQYQTLFWLAHRRNFSQLPSLIHRVRRCSVDDVAAIENAVSVLDLFGPSPNPPGFNLVVHLLIAARDFRGAPELGRAALEAAQDAAFMSTNGALSYLAAEEVWPAFPSDPATRQYPSTTVPMAIFHCMMDDVLALDDVEPMMTHYTGPHQRLHRIPNGTHVCGRTNFSCARRISTAFLENPETTAGVATISECQNPVTPGFSLPSTAELYGLTDPWD